MRKICVVTSNRSDYSKLKSVMEEINKREDLELIFIVTASHLLADFGTTINSIKKDGFKIDSVARTIIEGEDPVTMAKSVGLGSLEMPTLLDTYKPDIVLIVGDRFDILPVVISAALMNITIAHIQGGEVTGTIDESIRHVITKFAHIHFPSNKECAERIIKLGEEPSRVFNVGCPATDHLKKINEETTKDLNEFNNTYFSNINFSEPYLIFIQHPVTSEYEEAGKQIRESLEAISSLKIQTIMLYPNVDAGSTKMMSVIREYEDKKKYPQIFMYKHIEFEDYIKLLKNCSCIVGNSSSGIRESCFFGIPTVNIGTRQNGRQRGENVIDVDYKRELIKKAIEEKLNNSLYRPEFIYGEGGSGKKIAEVLATIKLKSTQKKITY